MNALDDPVDGFTVEPSGDHVNLVLSNRYGDTSEYEFPPADAVRIGIALIQAAAFIVPV